MGMRFVGVLALAVMLVPSVASARGGNIGRGGGVGPGLGRGGDVLRDRRARNDHLRRVAPQQQSNNAAASRRAPTPRPTQPNPPNANPTQPQAAPPSVVHLRKGNVRMVADLARVDYSLSVQNVGATTIEWRRSYSIDPAAQVIGAVLHRPGIAPVTSRTLTLADARRIYQETRTPRRPRTRTPRRPRDPLRLERVRRSQLDVIVWPIQPNETIRIALTFVTPLRGHGDTRQFIDVIEGTEQAGDRTPVRPEETAPETDVGVDENLIAAHTEWLVHPGELQVTGIPTGMRPAGSEDGMLRFVPGKDLPRRPTMDFRRTREAPSARIVQGGGFGKRVAVWRFDPQEFLRDRGFVNYPELSVRIVPKSKRMQRVAPNTFLGTDDPRPVTAVLRETPERVNYVVEVLGREGDVIDTFDRSIHARTVRYDRDLVGAITGWHRAMLVERVFDWARMNGSHNQAVAFAVDMGVLRPGTAALAVPPRERARLSPRSIRLYDNDGVPLGAQRREADMRPVPKGALD